MPTISLDDPDVKPEEQNPDPYARKYRVLEVDRNGIYIVYFVHYKPWWSPIWIELGYYFDLEGAKERIERDKKKCKRAKEGKKVVYETT